MTAPERRHAESATCGILEKEQGRTDHQRAPKTLKFQHQPRTPDQGSHRPSTRKYQVMNDRNAVEGLCTPSNDQWILPAEAASILGLSLNTLRSYRAARRRRGPAFTKLGHSVFYKRVDVEAYLLLRGEG